MHEHERFPANVQPFGRVFCDSNRRRTSRFGCGRPGVAIIAWLGPGGQTGSTSADQEEKVRKREVRPGM